MSCVTWTIVVAPCSTPVWMRRSRSWSSVRVSASTEANGSSSSSTCGRETSARAIATRCCIPPESFQGYFAETPSSPTSASARLGARSALGPGQAHRPQRERDVAHDVEPWEERTRVVLEHDGELARRPADRPPVVAAPRPRSPRSGRRGSGAASSCRTRTGRRSRAARPALTSNVIAGEDGRPVLGVALPEPQHAQRRAAAGNAVEHGHHGLSEPSHRCAP